MNLSLTQYILDHYSSSGKRMYTKSEPLKKRLDKYYPELTELIDLNNSKANYDDINLSELINKWADTTSGVLKNYEYIKYSDIIDEAKDIIENYDKVILVTQSQALIQTINAILDTEKDYNFLSSRELWVHSAESIFLLCKIGRIHHCCNHEWIDESMRSNLFCKNHVLRNQIVERFHNFGSEVNQKTMYPFRDLYKIHYEFLTSITDRLIKSIFDEPIDMQVTVYDYIKILKEHLDQKEPKFEGKLQIATLDELPFIDSQLGIWVAGISCDSPIPIKIAQHQTIARISFAEFVNGQMVYPQLGLSDAIIDKTKSYTTYFYEYPSPTPKPEHRKNAFAINHITKLLNNPHNFYVENILRLKPYTFHPNHVVGIMAHSMFEKLLQNVKEIKDYEAFKNQMHELLKQNYFNRVESITVFKKVETMLVHLWELVSGADTLLAEHEGMQTIMHNNKPYYLHGRADLIYEKDGQWGVIDFKTGTPPSWANIINGSAPQISIGMLMLRFGGFLEKEVEDLADSGFISPRGLFIVNSNTSVIQSAIEGIRAVIFRFWEEQSPYFIHINDMSWPYRSIARSVSK